MSSRSREKREPTDFQRLVFELNYEQFITKTNIKQCIYEEFNSKLAEPKIPLSEEKINELLEFYFNHRTRYKKWGTCALKDLAFLTEVDQNANRQMNVAATKIPSQAVSKGAPKIENIQSGTERIPEAAVRVTRGRKRDQSLRELASSEVNNQLPEKQRSSQKRTRQSTASGCDSVPDIEVIEDVKEPAPGSSERPERKVQTADFGSQVVVSVFQTRIIFHLLTVTFVNSLPLTTNEFNAKWRNCVAVQRSMSQSRKKQPRLEFNANC